MICRTWSGTALTAANADSYACHLEGSVFPRLADIAGHRGAYLLRREDGDRFEFLVLTMWESMRSIREFAGDDPTRAVVEPEARAVLNKYDSTVNHYEVILRRDA